MIILVGASASGKTEVAKLLSEKYHIDKMTTTTTRPMRINEVNGKDYFFISQEEFLRLQKEDAFVETTFYNNNYYGSNKDQIAINRSIVVDPKGMEAYLSLSNPIIMTFVLTAKENTRLNRMLVRGDKLKDAKERIKRDRIEFANDKVNKSKYYIETDSLSIEEVADIIYKAYKENIIDKF